MATFPKTVSSRGQREPVATRLDQGQRPLGVALRLLQPAQVHRGAGAQVPGELLVGHVPVRLAGAEGRLAPGAAPARSRPGWRRSGTGESTGSVATPAAGGPPRRSRRARQRSEHRLRLLQAPQADVEPAQLGEHHRQRRPGRRRAAGGPRLLQDAARRARRRWPPPGSVPPSRRARRAPAPPGPGRPRRPAPRPTARPCGRCPGRRQAWPSASRWPAPSRRAQAAPGATRRSRPRGAPRPPRPPPAPPTGAPPRTGAAARAAGSGRPAPGAAGTGPPAPRASAGAAPATASAASRRKPPRKTDSRRQDGALAGRPAAAQEPSKTARMLRWRSGTSRRPRRPARPGRARGRRRSPRTRGRSSRRRPAPGPGAAPPPAGRGAPTAAPSGGQGEVAPHPPGALGEEPHGGVAAPGLQVGRAVARGVGQPLHRVAPLLLQRQGLARGDQQLDPGAAGQDAASSAAPSSRCSKLSSTSSSGAAAAGRRAGARSGPARRRAAGPPRPRRRRRAGPPRRAAGGRRTCTPSGKAPRARAWAAARRARRVLPTPPGPTRVSRRQAGVASSPASSARSASRPTNGVGGQRRPLRPRPWPRLEAGAIGSRRQRGRQGVPRLRVPLRSARHRPWPPYPCCAPPLAWRAAAPAPAYPSRPLPAEPPLARSADAAAARLACASPRGEPEQLGQSRSQFRPSRTRRHLSRRPPTRAPTPQRAVRGTAPGAPAPRPPAPFACLSPDYAGWRDDLRQCVEEWDTRGLRLYPGYHGFHRAGDATADLLAAVEFYRLPVSVGCAFEDPASVIPWTPRRTPASTRSARRRAASPACASWAPTPRSSTPMWACCASARSTPTTPPAPPSWAERRASSTARRATPAARPPAPPAYVKALNPPSGRINPDRSFARSGAARLTPRVAGRANREGEDVNRLPAQRIHRHGLAASDRPAQQRDHPRRLAGRGQAGLRSPRLGDEPGHGRPAALHPGLGAAQAPLPGHRLLPVQDPRGEAPPRPHPRRRHDRHGQALGGDDHRQRRPAGGERRRQPRQRPRGRRRRLVHQLGGRAERARQAGLRRHTSASSAPPATTPPSPSPSPPRSSSTGTPGSTRARRSTSCWCRTASPRPA